MVNSWQPILFLYSHLHCSQLESLVAEHLDDLHYCNDILSLNVSSLNEILTEHLLNRLFIPLYVYSLFDVSAAAKKEEESPQISSKIALFLLSQVITKNIMVYCCILYLFYYVGMMQLPSLLSCLHSLYWINIVAIPTIIF